MKLTANDRRLIVAALAIAAQSRDDAAKRLDGVGSATAHELRTEGEAFRRVLRKLQTSNGFS